MNRTLDYFGKKFGLTVWRDEVPYNYPMPIQIRGVGRKDLADWFCELGFKRGAEIGVEAGLYSEVICKANPTVELFCVDAWAKLKYRYWVSQPKIDAYHQQAIERLAPFNCKFIQAWSMDAVKQFEDGELDFVYIDADHTYDATMNDITEWSKKVRSGGIVSGHDYIHRGGMSEHKVIRAVHQYADDHKIWPWFVLGAKDKKPGEVRDQCRSWMWVKE